MTKRKDERRELLKEDEFLSGMEKAARYMQQNPAQVLIALAVFLGLVAALTIYQAQNLKSANQRASAIYEAEKILQTNIDDETAELKFANNREKYEAALAKLNEVIPELSGIARHQAMVMKIGCLTSLGVTEELAELYGELADQGEGSVKLIGMMGQADLNLAEGRYDEAIDIYDRIEAAKLNGAAYEDLIIYKKALCLKGKGDETTARQELAALVDRYEGDESAQGEPPVLIKVRELLEELEGDDAKSES
ncbi:MAG: hypothetical protein QNK37_00290 [Acidobacteriota bacterium]|nr:hypothetical protein [Acidobacteriota bacterium]